MTYVADRYRVTRDVSEHAANNWTGRDVGEGEVFYEFVGVEYGSCDVRNGIVLTTDPEGGGAFFEFPRDAVEKVTTGHYHDPAGKYDYCDDPACDRGRRERRGS